MKDSKVSFRYANSLLENSIEKNNLDAVAADMELVHNSLKGSKELLLTLVSPIVKPQIKTSVLVEIFENRVTPDTMNFLKFVVQKNRENILSDIINKFLEIKDDYLGILNVEVTTSMEFNEGQKEELRKTLESKFNKKIRFSFKIDSTVIGGFIAKVADTLYDASIRHQLEILKKQFLHGNASLN